MHWAITPMSLYVHKQKTHICLQIFTYLLRDKISLNLYNQKWYYNSQLAEQSTEIKEFK